MNTGATSDIRKRYRK